MTYEYYVKRIDLKHVREGSILEEDYERYIHDFAAKGWRFVQLVDLTNLTPNTPCIELIFERKHQ